LRSAVPGSPTESGDWLTEDWRRAAFALNLIPFAGVAFLWFIGVLRDRLGAKEDRFFATVFFGSSLLFLGLLFTAASLVGALILVGAAVGPNALAGTPTFYLARAAAFILVNIYAAKIATVFMVSTSTVVIYTNIAPRWIAILGFALAAVLLVGSYFWTWTIIVLPIWVLLISIAILIDNMRTAPKR
jgi:MFS family permease